MTALLVGSLLITFLGLAWGCWLLLTGHYKQSPATPFHDDEEDGHGC